MEAKYRALVEQIPAVVFMASLDEGIGEAYVSPQIEQVLGFTQEEWLQDPVRWYQQVHPDDKATLERGSSSIVSLGEASAVGLSGAGARWKSHLVPLRSQNDPAGRWPAVVHSWRRLRHYRPEANGRSAAGRAQCRFRDPRYGGALVVVLDPSGRIIRFNRACERTTGYTFEKSKYTYMWELFTLPEEADASRHSSLRCARANCRTIMKATGSREMAPAI